MPPSRTKSAAAKPNTRLPASQPSDRHFMNNTPEYVFQESDLEHPANVKSSARIAEFFQQRQLEKQKLRRVAEFLNSPESLLVRAFLAHKDHKPELSWLEVAEDLLQATYPIKKIQKELG